MNDKEPEKIYTEEKIVIIKPLKANHIFNDEKFERIETYMPNGDKLVILREKNE